MIVTEQEAATKWCPHVRATAETGGKVDPAAWNRIGKSNSFVASEVDGLCCIGSRCMAWRWAERDDGTGYIERIGKGFCGLAGEP